MVFSRWTILLLMSCLFVSSCEQFTGSHANVSAGAAPIQTNEEYRLGVGDVISIRIYGGEEEIRMDRVRLNAPGTLTFQFGEFTAPGRTTRELEAAMVKAMRGTFLVNPKVWINIDEYRPFYVQGQVGRPGAFPYQPGLNVNKAVTVAGGFRERASKRRIFLVRENDKTNTRMHVDLHSPVGPGDTLTVEESFF